jgi:hypothetical protein
LAMTEWNAQLVSTYIIRCLPNLARLSAGSDR